MKILRLHLIAFGHFTDMELDFSGGREGFHLVHGPNEAGKSTALQAIHQLLYGIPHISRHGFVHPNPKMRIGGVLGRKDGSELEFIRRKGRVNTLRMADDSTVLEQSRLNAFLFGIEPEVFASMFGIDHAGLREGGRDIVRGEGEVGRLLFSAGGGISDLRKVQFRIQSKAEALFLAKGKNPKINQALQELKQLRKELRESALSGEQWEKHRRALETADAQQASTREEISQKKAQLNRLERIRDSLPEISRLSEITDELESLGDVVPLSEDFSTRRKDLLTRRQLCLAEKKNAEKNIADLEENLEKLSVPERILAMADKIESLQKELGSFTKGRKDREKAVLEKEHLRQEAAELLRNTGMNIDLAEARSHFPSKRETIRIRELIKNYDLLRQARETCGGQVESLAKKTKTVKLKLDRLPEAAPKKKLKRAIKNTGGEGDIEKLLDGVCLEIKSAQETLEMDRKDLGLTGWQLHELEKLEIIPEETIESFEQEWTEIENRARGLREELQKTRKKVLTLDGEVRKMQQQKVPSLDDLSDIRAWRDQGWSLIRRAWKDGVNDPEAEARFMQRFSSVTQLDEAYEKSVEKSDHLADRLRTEADRAAQKENLVCDLETQRQIAYQAEKDLERAESDFQKIKMNWHDRWKACGIIPEPPFQMRRWRLKFEQLSRRVSELGLRLKKREELENKIRVFKRELREGLAEAKVLVEENTGSLAALLDRCREESERIDENIRLRERLLAELEQHENDFAEAVRRQNEAQVQLEKWKRDWTNAIEPLRLSEDTDTSEVDGLLEDIAAIGEMLKKSDSLERTIISLDTEARQFETSARSMMEQAAPDLFDLTNERAVEELNIRLKKAREKKARRDSLQENRQKEHKRLEVCRGDLERIDAQLLVLQKEAQVDSMDQLEKAEKKSIRRKELESERETTRARLRKQAGGAALEDFIAQVRKTDPDSIGPELERLDRQINSLEAKKAELHETIGTERNELERMDAGSGAAELNERMQSLLGGLESDVQKYVRFRLGQEVLSQAIETYREKHQGTVLRRSGELFSRLTGGSFETLTVEPGEKGGSVLMGVRPGGKERVDVEGMSDGSLDQLYLSVRLASLENYMEQNEPMPFILDDILINFDNQRAAATLKALSELSEKTQIVFFTHHRHLVELAQEHVGGENLFIHRLSG